MLCSQAFRRSKGGMGRHGAEVLFLLSLPAPDGRSAAEPSGPGRGRAGAGGSLWGSFRAMWPYPGGLQGCKDLQERHGGKGLLASDGGQAGSGPGRSGRDRLRPGSPGGHGRWYGGKPVGDGLPGSRRAGEGGKGGPGGHVPESDESGELRHLSAPGQGRR